MSILPKNRRAWIRLSVWFLAFGISSFLLGMVLLRTRNPIGFPPATGLIGATAFVALLCPVLLGLALFLRNKLFIAFSAVLLVLFGYWGSADFRFGPGEGEAPAEAIRVATANVYIDNPDPVTMMLEILAQDPDVILLQELSPSIWELIEAMPETASYEHRAAHSRDNQDGTAILSRLPLVDATNDMIGMLPVTRADIMVGSVSVRLISLHISAPLTTTLVRRGDTQINEIRDLVDSYDGVLLLAGDFNATVQHERFQRLMGDDLYDAHQQAGRGFGATWGHRRLSRLPAVLRIDHILMDAPLEAVHSWTEPLSGSDHRALFADIVVRDDAG